MDVTETTINALKVQKEIQKKTSKKISEITEDIEYGLNKARESSKLYTDTETLKLRNDIKFNNAESKYENSLELTKVKDGFERYKLNTDFSIEKLRYETKTDIKMLKTEIFKDCENLAKNTEKKFEEIIKTLDYNKNSITKLEKILEKLLLLNKDTNDFSNLRTKREENKSEWYIQFLIIALLTIPVGAIVAVLFQWIFSRKTQVNPQFRSEVQQIPPVGDTTSIDSFGSL